MSNTETVIKDLGNDLYEISCCPVACFMFSIDEYLPVGKVAGADEAIALWGTENQLFSLWVDFTCKIVEVNQPFIDCLGETEGKDFEYKGFSQTDWICRVQKVNENENINPYFRENYANNDNYHLRPLPCWIKNIGADVFELGYFSYFLPLEYYIRNIKILNESCKAGEKICSFEYYPVSSYAIKKTERWEYADKYKQIGYLYALCDLEKVVDFNPIFNPMLHEQPIYNGWILIDIKDDFILKVKRKVI